MKKTVLIIMIGLAAMLFLPSCEKDVVYYMKLFYEESLGLKGQTPDSIWRFNDKVESYVTAYPDERESHYYPLILENINMAIVHIEITVETDWLGEREIKFIKKK